MANSSDKQFSRQRVTLFAAGMAFLATAAMPVAASAQDSSDIVRPGVVYASASGITVAGHGEIQIMPDIARTTLTVETTEPDESRAVSENAAKVRAVIAALKSSAVAQKDIQNTSYFVNTNRDYTANPPALTGYTVTNSVDVTLRDISKVGVVIDKATTAGATVDGVNFDLADKDHVQGEALVAAVTDARSKADLIAGASGVSVGRVLSISEQSAEQPVFKPFMMSRAAMATQSSAPPTSLSPQQVTITADVTATYAVDYSQR